MEDSSDDDKPIGQRSVLQGVPQAFQDSDSDRGSPIPDWISQNPTPAKKPVLAAEDSEDSDIIDLGSQPAPQKPGPSKLGSKNAEKKVQGPSIDEKIAALSPKKPAQGNNKAAAHKEQASHQILAQGFPPAGSSKVAKPAAAVSENAPAGEIPLMLPEKLVKGRYLVELEGNDSGGTDLAGDTGAVGRFTQAGAPGREGQLLLDLKGCIYSTSLVKCATTLCVVSLQPSEAKVEALLDSYVMLGQEAELNGGAADQDFFMYDDDDNYQVDDGNAHAAKAGKRKGKPEDGEAGPKAKKARAAPKPAAKRKPAAKKKPPAKAKAKRGGKK